MRLLVFVKHFGINKEYNERPPLGRVQIFIINNFNNICKKLQYYLHTFWYLDGP